MGDVEQEVYDDFISKLDHEIDYLDFLDARGVELLPNSNSSLVSFKVEGARLLFLLVVSGLANLGFPG